MIGADGVNSVIANYVGVRGTRVFKICAVRGYTYYEQGHHFVNEFLLLRKSSPFVQLGRMPMTDNLVYWFITREWSSEGTHFLLNLKILLNFQDTFNFAITRHACRA